jgi:hypothetical protein
MTTASRTNELLYRGERWFAICPRIDRRSTILALPPDQPVRVGKRLERGLRLAAKVRIHRLPRHRKGADTPQGVVQVQTQASAGTVIG